jgi:hypothetical protein
VTPWIEGETADLSPPDSDQGERLAGFFDALHKPTMNLAQIAASITRRANLCMAR